MGEILSTQSRSIIDRVHVFMTGDGSTSTSPSNNGKDYAQLSSRMSDDSLHPNSSHHLLESNTPTSTNPLYQPPSSP